MDADRILERARRILEDEGNAILAKRGALGGSFVSLVRRILALPGRVVVTGIGKSGIIGEKIAATLSSTGTPAFFLRPVDALHGDLGTLQRGDLLLAISNSGETEEVLAVALAAKGLGLPLAAFTGAPESTLAREAEISVDVGVEREACPLGLAPTASTTTTLAVGDALAMALLEERGFTRDHYARFHPGGSLGQRLQLRVRDLMRADALLPKVSAEAPLHDALREMSARENLGVTVVLDGVGRLAGVSTDGDLRRILLSRPPQEAESILSRPCGEFMTRKPKVIEPEVSASEALRIMEVKGITSLVVVNALDRPEGIVHLHDILGRGKVLL
ncbi:MAG: KpsF/GutQ family sugar-phosphate isomerase [Thermoanaerobaculia bacterium]